LSSFFYAQPVNNFVNLNVAILRDLWFNTRMKVEGQRILISPNRHASQRTKNRIREHGANGFIVEKIRTGLEQNEPTMWLLRASDGWLGWLPRMQFRLECVGEEFFVEKF